MTCNPYFKFAIIQRQITRKWYNTELYLGLQWPTNKKSYMIYRTAPSSMILNDSIERRHWTTSLIQHFMLQYSINHWLIDPYPRFQGHAIFWRWMSQKLAEIRSSNWILIGTYTRLTQQCHFKWPWVKLSDLEWLSKIVNNTIVARSLCDSWASCETVYISHWMTISLQEQYLQQCAYSFTVFCSVKK